MKRMSNPSLSHHDGHLFCSASIFQHKSMRLVSSKLGLKQMKCSSRQQQASLSAPAAACLFKNLGSSMRKSETNFEVVFGHSSLATDFLCPVQIERSAIRQSTRALARSNWNNEKSSASTKSIKASESENQYESNNDIVSSISYNVSYPLFEE